MTSLRTLVDRAVAGPDYPPNGSDLADVRLAGLAVPIRASVVVLATTAIIVADQLRLFVPGDGGGQGQIAGLESLTIERLVLFLVVPVVIIALAFRDSPARYALRLGDWRWGAALLAAGLVVMTPIILALAQLPEFRAFYGAEAVPLAGGTLLVLLSRWISR